MYNHWKPFTFQLHKTKENTILVVKTTRRSHDIDDNSYTLYLKEKFPFRVVVPWKLVYESVSFLIKNDTISILIVNLLLKSLFKGNIKHLVIITSQIHRDICRSFVHITTNYMEHGNNNVGCFNITIWALITCDRHVIRLLKALQESDIKYNG